MKILVTGSSGHLGEALMRTFRSHGRPAFGIDILPAEFTDEVGSIVDREFVRNCMQGVGAVIHSATLHKPHVVTHSRQNFVDTNITGTVNLLEEAADAGVSAFIFTSTTSAFGSALSPPAHAPAAWITEDVRPVPRNIYGVTKTAAEDMCELFHRKQRLPCLILRTSRFFPEEDDRPRYAKATKTPTQRSTRFSIGGWTWRMWSARICWRSRRPVKLDSGDTLSALQRRSLPAIWAH